MTIDEFKKQYSFNVEKDIEWADMDAFQHVNNTVYFLFFEKIRIAYFENSGLISSMTESGIGPILASTQCRYKIPLTFPDAVVIGAYITDLQADRFLMKYAVYSIGHKGIAAQGDGMIVCYNYKKGEKASIPEAIFSKLQAAEQTT
jgi:acyl-CoA thioester hydrolase